jgi:competence protein ComEC
VNFKLYLAVALSLAALVFARYQVLGFFEARASLAGYAERTAVVAGTVAGDPDKRATSVRVPVKVRTVNGQDAPRGTLLALLPRETELAYGERVEVRGLIKLPESFETDTGRVFDYPGYLRVRGISAVMGRAELRSSEPAGFTLLGPLYALKHVFEESLEQSIDEPEVSLLEGMLLGERGGFSNELMHAFIVVGLVHIVVLSGSNITIIAEAVFRLLGLWRGLPRGWLYALGFAAIVLFALMAGGGAATVRAVIMGAIAILARYLRRPRAALRALMVAAVLMVLWNPLVLFYDNGFVLSVLATFGLITLAPFIESKLSRLPSWRHFNMRSIVASTIAVELFILPALLYTSGTFSLFSLPVNALVLPVVPLVMAVGFAAGVLGFLHPLFALIPAFAAQLMLRLIIGISELAASVPVASAIVAPFPLWAAVMAYAPLTGFALWAYAGARRAPRDEPLT